MQAGGHGEASVLDLHLLPAAVLVRHLVHELERVEDAERLGRADVACRSRLLSRRATNDFESFCFNSRTRK